MGGEGGPHHGALEALRTQLPNVSDVVPVRSSSGTGYLLWLAYLVSIIHYIPYISIFTHLVCSLIPLRPFMACNSLYLGSYLMIRQCA